MDDKERQAMGQDLLGSQEERRVGLIEQTVADWARKLSISVANIVAIARIENWVNAGKGERGSRYDHWRDSMIHEDSHPYCAELYTNDGLVGSGRGDTIAEAIDAAFKEMGG